MSDYISFKVPRVVDVQGWLLAQGLLDHITYDWNHSILTFDNKEDAVSFSLKFGIQRYMTKLDELLLEISNEESND